MGLVLQGLRVAPIPSYGEGGVSARKGNRPEDRAQAALGAELEQGVGGEVGLVVDQQLPGGLEQRPFDRARVAARAVDGQQQRAFSPHVGSPPD